MPFGPNTSTKAAIAVSNFSRLVFGGSRREPWRGTLFGSVRREYRRSLAASASFDKRAGTPLWTESSFGMGVELDMVAIA
jgi:hypothetical protein